MLYACVGCRNEVEIQWEKCICVRLNKTASTVPIPTMKWPRHMLPNWINSKYNENRQVSNIRRTLVGNKIVDNSDVVGVSPVGAAPTTSELST